MTLFVDTSGLYALLVASEQGHVAVTNAFREAAEAGRRLYTTNYVLVETAALLQHRIGLEPVRDLDARIVPVLEVRWIDEALHRRGVERLFRTDKRRVSFVDAVSFTVMEDEGGKNVLGLDPDFATEGFRLVP